jgi:hypothetical protein
MKNETILRASLVLSIILLLWVTVMWNNDIVVMGNQKNTIDSLKNRSDSLYDENFIKSVEMGRDELTWEYLKENYPNVYNNAINFKSHETE